jgi:hypothetical protein
MYSINTANRHEINPSLRILLQKLPSITLLNDIPINAFPTRMDAWPNRGLGPSPVALILYAVILASISPIQEHHTRINHE